MMKGMMNMNKQDNLHSRPRTALVTGGAGFLGSHICRRLINDGYVVTAMDNMFTGAKRNIADLIDNDRFTLMVHDVTVPFGGRYDEIYNFACPASPVHYQSNPVATALTSSLGIMHVLNLAHMTGAKVMHASTSEIYGDPLVHPQTESYWGNVNTIGVRSCYDEGKRFAETLVSDYRRCHGVDARMIRIFNTYGPNMDANDGRVISNFIVQALSGKPITVYGDGSQTRSFQYCDDLIDLIMRFMRKSASEVDEFFAERTSGCPVLNAGNPNEFTVSELACEVMSQIQGTGSSVVYRPLPSDDPKRRRPDITYAKEFLGWEPNVQLKDGVSRTIAYFRRFIG